MAEEKDPIQELMEMEASEKSEVIQEPVEQEAPEEEEEESPEVEEENKPEVEVPVLSTLEGEDKEAKIAELLESEEISDEEAKFLKDNGHEIVFEGEEPEKPEKKEEAPEEKPLEKPVFASEFESLFPEKEFNTREDYDNAVVDYIQKEKEANQKLVAALEDNPNLQLALTDMIGKGITFEEAIAKHVDIELLTAKPGDDNYEAVVRAKIERENNKKLAEEARRQFAENQQKSVQESIEFVQEKKLDNASQKKFFDKIDSLISDFNKGKVTKGFLEIMSKGLDYDNSVKSAEERGEVKGRNEGIKTFKRKQKGDGVPKLKSVKDRVSSAPKKKYDDPVQELMDM